MEYYMPPPPPDPRAGHYYQYQYAPGFLVPPPPPHMNMNMNPHPLPFDPSVNVEHHYTNYEGGDHDIPNFDVNPSPIPIESREVSYTLPSAHASMKMGTVYKKAPGAPKRFKSSYVHFFGNFLERKKQELGGVPTKLDMSLMSKDCSKEWKALPVNQRKYWDSVSEREKEEYNRQREAYQGPWRIATKKVKKKKEGAPKRSPSAFFLFVNVKRPVLKEQCSDMPNTTVVKTCSKLWKELSETEKTPFQEKEKKLRAQYHIEAEIWKKKLQEEEEREKEEEKARTQRENATKEARATDDYEIEIPEPIHRPTSASVCVNPLGFVPPSVATAAATTPSRSKKRKRDPRAPKRSPPAFFLFVNHCRPELKMQNPELRHTELVKMLGHRWSEMSDEDKRPFREHEEQLRQQYHIDIKHYKKGAVPEQEYYNLPNAMKPHPRPPPILHAPCQEVHYQQPNYQPSLPYYRQPPPMREENVGYQQAPNF